MGRCACGQVNVSVIEPATMRTPLAMAFADGWLNGFRAADAERTAPYGDEWAARIAAQTKQGLEDIAADPQQTVRARATRSAPSLGALLSLCAVCGTGARDAARAHTRLAAEPGDDRPGRQARLPAALVTTTPTHSALPSTPCTSPRPTAGPRLCGTGGSPTERATRFSTRCPSPDGHRAASPPRRTLYRPRAPRSSRT